MLRGARGLDIEDKQNKNNTSWVIVNARLSKAKVNMVQKTMSKKIITYLSIV